MAYKLGVLLSGVPDDGEGSARRRVLLSLDEVKTGVTSALTYVFFGLDREGRVLNERDPAQAWESAIDECYKLVSFIDCGGCTRRTIKGFLAADPDYGAVVLSAARPAAESVAVVEQAMATQSRFCVLLTHIDRAAAADVGALLGALRDVFYSFKGFVPVVVRGEEDAIHLAKAVEEAVVPVFLLSCVTGANLTLFRHFLNTLPVTRDAPAPGAASEFVVLRRSRLKGQGREGVILSGFVVRGRIQARQRAFLGPLGDRRFTRVFVQEIECYKIRVREAVQGQSCSLLVAAQEPGRDLFPEVHKGVVLATGAAPPRLARGFTAEMRSCGPPPPRRVSFAASYEPVVFSETFEQICAMRPAELARPRSSEGAAASALPLPKARAMSECVVPEFGSAPDAWCFDAHTSNTMGFLFKHRAEYARVDQRIAIFDNKLRAFGRIVALDPA